MAQRSMDDGKGGTRGADVSPPGSRERGEAHVTGWSPEKEVESMELRQGPFHRAATERLYNPRGGVDAGDVGPRQADGSIIHGPSSMEDVEDNWRSERSRRGRLPEHELRGEALSAEHRAARGGDVSAEERGSDERRALRERDVERDTGRGYREERGWRDERYDAALGLDSASPGIPGRAVGPGSLRAGGRRRWAREPLTAREIMTRGVKSVRRDSPLREVAQLMKDEDCGVVPIVDERGTLVGLVTDRDLVIRAFTGARSPEALRAGDVMTDDVQAVTPDENIHSIIELMGRRQVRRVPVVDRDDRLMGIISMGDIANRADYDEELQEALDRVSARRSFWNRLG